MFKNNFVYFFQLIFVFIVINKLLKILTIIKNLVSDVWNKQFEQYENLINASYTKEDFLLTGKMDLLNKSLSTTSKLKINKINNENKEDTPLSTSTELIIRYNYSQKTYFSLTNNKDINIINFNFPVFRKIFLSGKMPFNNNEKEETKPSSFYLNFDLNNSNSLTGINLLEYHLKKSIIPNVIALYYIQKSKLYGKNISYGLYSGYSILKNYFKFYKCLFTLKGEKINTIFDISFDRNKNDEKLYDKTLSLKTFVDVNKLYKLGGDTKYNTSEEKVDTRLFFNYNPKKYTVIKGKYENNDNSISLSICQQFRGLMKFNITGKFNIINNDSLFKFPSFKSKFGFNIDLNETVI